MSEHPSVYVNQEGQLRGFGRAPVGEFCRFEMIRRVLGHAATLTLEEIEALPWGGETGLDDEAGVAAYAEAIRQRQIEQDEDGYPTPVIPHVDMENLTVTHTTCTGNTSMRLTLPYKIRPCGSDINDYRWNCWVNREKEWDWTESRDIAIVMIAELIHATAWDDQPPHSGGTTCGDPSRARSPTGLRPARSRSTLTPRKFARSCVRSGW